jgi:hypothetical protein
MDSPNDNRAFKPNSLPIRKLMSGVVLCLGVLICLGATSASNRNTSEKHDNDQQALIDLEKQSWVAWKNHDGAFFQRFLSDDHVEMVSHGPVGKAAIVDMVSGGACTVQDYTVDQFSVSPVDANTVIVTYHAAQTTLCGGSPVPTPAWATSIFAKRSGRWINVFYEQIPASK